MTDAARKARILMSRLGEGNYKTSEILAAAQVWALLAVAESLEKKA